MESLCASCTFVSKEVRHEESHRYLIAIVIASSTVVVAPSVAEAKTALQLKHESKARAAKARSKQKSKARAAKSKARKKPVKRSRRK